MWRGTVNSTSVPALERLHTLSCPQSSDVLAHPGKAQMPVASRFHYFWVDVATVVSDSHLQMSNGIVHNNGSARLKLIRLWRLRPGQRCFQDRDKPNLMVYASKRYSCQQTKVTTPRETMSSADFRHGNIAEDYLIWVCPKTASACVYFESWCCSLPRFLYFN
jgi:hypothetical protein